MQFTAYVMQGASVEARAVIVSRDGETPEALADRARATLVENAAEVRDARSEQVMTVATLDRFADLFRDVVAAQAASGARRSVTAYTRGGEEVHHSEGQIALLGRSTDITCLIEATDDETLRKNGFRAAATRELGREPRPEDVRLVDADVSDLFQD
jgi:hypothetical protein